MKLTAVLIMPVNTKDRHQVFSEKDEVHLVKDLEYNLLGKVANIFLQLADGLAMTTCVAEVNWLFSGCLFWYSLF